MGLNRHDFPFLCIVCIEKTLIRSDAMRIVVMRPPKILLPMVRKVLGIKKEDT